MKMGTVKAGRRKLGVLEAHSCRKQFHREPAVEKVIPVKNKDWFSLRLTQAAVILHGCESRKVSGQDLRYMRSMAALALLLARKRYRGSVPGIAKVRWLQTNKPWLMPLLITKVRRVLDRSSTNLALSRIESVVRTNVDIAYPTPGVVAVALPTLPRLSSVDFFMGCFLDQYRKHLQSTKSFVLRMRSDTSPSMKALLCNSKS